MFFTTGTRRRACPKTQAHKTVSKIIICHNFLHARLANGRTTSNFTRATVVPRRSSIMSSQLIQSAPKKRKANINGQSPMPPCKRTVAVALNTDHRNTPSTSFGYFYKDFILRGGGKLPEEEGERMIMEHSRMMPASPMTPSMMRQITSPSLQTQLKAIAQYKMINQGGKDFTFVEAGIKS